jgi:hypothetical protein
VIYDWIETNVKYTFGADILILAYDTNLSKHTWGTVALLDNGDVAYITIQELCDILYARKYDKQKIINRMNARIQFETLTKIFALYADDNTGHFPDDIQHLQTYLEPDISTWALQNVECLKNVSTDLSTTPIAYDKILLQNEGGTNVLFNGFTIAFFGPGTIESLKLR